MSELLQARDIHHAYRGKVVLHGASLHLGPGEVVSLLGANGAGKSTLLRILLGLLTPTSGEVRLAGRLLADYPRRELARQVAYVPQVHSTPFPYTVRQIVTMGRLPSAGLFAAPGRDDRSAVDRVLERLTISHLAERPYTEISGGERQLALIARALAQGSRLLIMDEPATGLDYGNQLRLLERLAVLAGEGYGILMTTHHPDHALVASRRVLLMRNGRIEADGPPAAVVTAQNIQRLYGVAVDAVHAADGRHITFRPTTRHAACLS